MTRMLPRRSRRVATNMMIAALVAPLVVVAGEARATEWTVLPEKSEIGFSGSAAGQTIEGVFEDFSADVMFDPSKPAETKATIIIELDSVNTGNSDVDGTLPGSDWFNTSEYPQATFTADSAEPAEAENAYLLSGTLELKGNAGSITAPATIDISGDTASATGSLTIKRLEYGVGPDGPISGITVSEDVTISFTLQAERAE